MAEGDRPTRCAHMFDPEAWEESNDRACQVDPEDDADILEEVDGRSVWRCPHEAVGEHDGEGKCVFHLSPEKRPDGVDPVGEFVAIVDGERESVDGEGKRPARFIDATFEGLDLDREGIGDVEVIDLRHARIGKMVWEVETVDAPLDASGAVIEGECVGESVSFGGEVRFVGTGFRDEVSFADPELDPGEILRGATFDNGATFDGGADFRRATFDGGADFRRATFDGPTYFTNVVFDEISLSEVVFEDDVRFRTDLSEKRFPISMFQGPADFTELTARNEIDFRVIGSERAVSKRIRLFVDGADFTDASVPDSDFGGTRIGAGTDLSDATLEGATLRDADFGGTNMENTELEGADLRNANLTGANLENAILTRSQLYGTDFTDARLHGTLFGDARISDATTFLDRGVMWSPLRRLLPFVNRLLDPFGREITEAHTVIYDPRTDPVYEPESERGGEEDSGVDEDDDISNHSRAAAVYQALESLARDNAASTLASTCFAWRKDMERKRFLSDEGQGNSRQVVRWLFSWLSNLVTRYGESPYRVLATAALVILGSGGLYYGLGLIERTPESRPPVSLFEALYFSTMTFTTLGYGDFLPASWHGQLLAISETSAGVVLLALLVFVFGRRATR